MITRGTAEQKRTAWRIALMKVAEELGKESEVYKILGSLAWGRHEGEQAVHETKDNVVFGLGYLKGYRDATLAATRVLNLKGERALANCHP